ncbi:peptidylprolyl isomerase [Mangrovivirga sp. M17]|uniref:peptidylprolyl isomerase n=1 Tax=Mangrovivirga halotolerans TaxID=2993936 RepID=A0ABT3RVX1_9BACT|nr:peptidylprolyl isomerase [Mangrovivirga halotolerans]MCX2745924.1 peptidylprolyl isomerase [Mangrovivirga halotolerans]
MLKQLPLLLLTAILISCDSKDLKYSDNGFSWSDPEIKELYLASQNRNDEIVEKRLSSDNAFLVLEALKIAGSFPSDRFIDEIKDLLKVEDQQIRMKAAFAAGQNGSPELLEPLKDQFSEEKISSVKKELLIAIGKIDGEQSITFLSGFKPKTSPEIEGQTIGLFHCLLNNNITNSAVRLMTENVGAKNLSNEARRYSAGYLGRLPVGFDLNRYAGKLREAFNSSKDQEEKQHLLIAFSRCNRDVKTLEILKEIAQKENEDFRYRVLALQSLQFFPYIEARESVYKAALSENSKVAKEAANYFINLGNSNDAVQYLSLGAKQTYLPAAAMLLQAACKFGSKQVIEKVLPYVQNQFEKTNNPYDKAALIPLYIYSDEGIKKLSIYAREGNHPVIRTTALNILTKSLLDDYKENPDQVENYAEELAGLLFSSDTVVVRQTAGLFMSNDLNLQKYLDEKMISRIDTVEELNLLSKFLKTGAKPGGNQRLKYNPSHYDVSQLQDYSDTLNAEIITNEGVIEIELYPEIAPITVINFLNLSKVGYFSNNNFHRVENNFVIQDGCPRGDGYGHPPYRIISEFSPNSFEKGVLAMASSGRDTESSQWFITHRFSPHLDGAYTIFGAVKGTMDEVYEVLTGTEILDIVIKK